MTCNFCANWPINRTPSTRETAQNLDRSGSRAISEPQKKHQTIPTRFLNRPIGPQKMDAHLMKGRPPGHFTRELRRLNGYTEGELRAWLFEPGMKFAETDKWWKPGSFRDRPHEGLDLLIFLDERRERHLLPPGTAIPPLLSGTRVARIPDFLGETVILAHSFLDEAGRRLHTFYAHLQPTTAPATGKIMAPGSLIGKIGGAGKTATPCPPHLHLSLAWVDAAYPIQDFRWDGFCAAENFKPGDPLALISQTRI